MKDFLISLDRQILSGLAIGRAFSLPKSYRGFSTVLFSGVGGSGISSDILSTLARTRTRIPFYVHRGGRLPAWVGPKTLAIFTSYSGNTWEVLDSFHQAERAGAKTLFVTSGGRLETLGRRKKIPTVTIPSGLPPRCAVGYLTFCLIPVLGRVAGLRVGEAELKDALQAVRLVSLPRARDLAKKIKGRILYLYGTSGTTEPVTIRWRSQLAENAKELASHHLFPEMLHNEVEGWQNSNPRKKNAAAIFFSDPEDPTGLKKKKKFLQNRMRRGGVRVLELSASSRTPLGRIFSLIALGDWVSYELALLKHINPLEVPILEAIKKIK